MSPPKHRASPPQPLRRAAGEDRAGKRAPKSPGLRLGASVRAQTCSGAERTGSLGAPQFPDPHHQILSRSDTAGLGTAPAPATTAGEGRRKATG